MEELNKLSKMIIGEAIEVHKELGSRLLETAYQACLFYALAEKGLKVEKEKSMLVKFKRLELDCGYRIDLLVEDKLVVDEISNIHMAQILSYLKMGDFKLGL